MRAFHWTVTTCMQDEKYKTNSTFHKMKMSFTSALFFLAVKLYLVLKMIKNELNVMLQARHCIKAVLLIYEKEAGGTT